MTGKKCEPAEECAEPYSHHWIGPDGGDIEPWIWVKNDEIWLRGGQSFTPAEMRDRGWVYRAPSALPDEVDALRCRVVELEGALRPDFDPSDFNPRGKGFLEWIADRIEHVYGEHSGTDFLLVLRGMAEKQRAALTKDKP